jgi:hypothetical protein
MRRLRRSPARRDTGAIALIVTVLFASSVLVGCAALSVDVGQMMSEKRQLQNGADASALSLAQTCGLDPTKCSVTGGQMGGAAVGTSKINDSNAQDLKNGFDTSQYANGICGRSTPGLPSCGSTTGRITDCTPLPSYLTSDTTIPYVEVHTLTRTTSGSTILPSVFAGALTGSAGGPIAACSRASWGAIGTFAGVMPVTFSLCEWQTYTGSPPDFYPPPSDPAPGYGGASQAPWPSPATTPATPRQEIVIYLQDHGPTTTCHTFNGHDVPGGFGYLQASSTSCGISVTTSAWVQIDTGNSTPCDFAPLVGTVVPLPIFDCTVRSTGAPTFQPTTTTPCATGTGNNTWYHIINFAGFYVSGYKTGGSQEHASLVPPGTVMPCSNGDRCISGWFVRDSFGGGTPNGPPNMTGNLGAFTVATAG